MGMAARLGDPTAHGGTIVVGCPTVLIGGMPAARVGDNHVCPMLNPGVPPPPHVGGPVVLGSFTVLIGGMPAARMGDMVVCAGPPDTIMMGCPTVMIGEAGSGSSSGGGAGSPGSSSAAASAKTALSGNVESTTKQQHWIEFEFADKAGNPVSGISYKLNDSNKKDSFGNLRLDGRIMRDALPEGEGKVILRSLFNASWSKDKAKMGDKVKLNVESEGIDDGEKLLFTIWKRDFNTADALIKTIETNVNGNKANVEWEYAPPKEDSDKKDGDINHEKFKYSSPEFYFNALVEPDLTARSGLLYFEDFIEIELIDTDDNKPIKNEEYIIYLSNGEVRKGKLDNNGYKKEEKLPGGIYNIKFPKIKRFKEE
jgi:uncharacterized Zn-binding protein involved in type VI secretion